MTTPLSQFRQEYLVALGRITVNMNMLEQWTRTCMVLLFDNDSASVLFAVFSAEKFGRLLQILRLVFHQKVSDTQLLAEFEQLWGRLDKLYMERNTYIHSLWLFAEDDSYVMRMKYLKWPRVDQEHQPNVNSLNKLADNLGAISKELIEFMNKVVRQREDAANT